MVERRAVFFNKADSSSGSCTDPIVTIITCLSAVYSLFGADLTGWSPRKTIDHWRSCVDACGGDWLKFTKWKLASFYSVHMDQPIPYAPKGIVPIYGVGRGMDVPVGSRGDHPSILLGGVAGRWFRTRMYLWTPEERLEFLFSIKQSKKGMPRAGKEYLEKSAEETVVRLTTAKPVLGPKALIRWGDYDENPIQDLYVSRLSIEKELRRTVQELYAGKKFLRGGPAEPFFPSTSANYIRSRKEGGAVTEVMDLIRELELTLPPSTPSVLGKGLSGLEWGLTVDKKLGEGLGDEYHFEGYDSEGEKSDEKDTPTAAMWVDDSAFAERFVLLYDALRSKALAEEPVVSPVALPEALKVRVISKGPPFLNTYLKPVQAFCWKVLAEHPAFAVAGPVDEWVLQGRLGAKLKDGESYLSGDYSAATDELCSWVSEVIAREISDVCGFDGVDKALFVRSLTGHVFDDGRKQMNGQLMGSVTSFPVLCIANAAMCRRSYELGHHLKGVSLKRWPGIVNGDDIAMRCNALSRDIWGKMTAYGGLIESVGKTYFDPDFVEINSRCYIRRSEAVMGFCATADNNPHRPLWFKPVGFVNLGLLYGVKRSGMKVGRTDVYGKDSLGARARDLIESAPVRLRDKVMEQFVRHNWKVLTSLKVPWYMPEWLGGLGLPGWFSTVTGDFHGPSMQDIATAQRLVRQWHEPGKSARRVNNSEWQIRKLVQDRISTVEITVDNTEDNATRVAASRRFFGECCVSLLFQKDVNAEDLRKGGGKSGHAGRAYTKSLNHNAKLWSNANRQLKGKVRGLHSFAQRIFDTNSDTVDIYDVTFLPRRAMDNV